jgi:hypothetical protein
MITDLKAAATKVHRDIQRGSPIVVTHLGVGFSLHRK